MSELSLKTLLCLRVALFFLSVIHPFCGQLEDEMLRQWGFFCQRRNRVTLFRKAKKAGRKNKGIAPHHHRTKGAPSTFVSKTLFVLLRFIAADTD